MFQLVKLKSGEIHHAYVEYGQLTSTIQYLDNHGEPSYPVGQRFIFNGYFDGKGWHFLGGYQSEFENYIKEHFGGNEMSKHIIKLTKERDELKDKIIRLKKFMKSEQFKKLDQMDQMLLKTQKHEMKALLKTIEMRVEWEFNNKHYEMD